MRTERCLTIKWNQLTAAGGLWAAAIVLMLAETFIGADGGFSRWGFVSALGAATVSVSVMIARARRCVLDVISWEHQQTRNAHGPGSPQMMPLQRV